jgi:hypothetical protein
VTFTKAPKAKGKTHKTGTLDLTPDDSQQPDADTSPTPGWEGRQRCEKRVS